MAFHYSLHVSSTIFRADVIFSVLIATELLCDKVQKNSIKQVHFPRVLKSASINFDSTIRLPGREKIA